MPVIPLRMCALTHQVLVLSANIEPKSTTAALESVPVRDT